MSWDDADRIKEIFSDILFLSKQMTEFKNKKIVYTEDGIPVRKLYFTMPVRKVSSKKEKCFNVCKWCEVYANSVLRGRADLLRVPLYSAHSHTKKKKS